MSKLGRMERRDNINPKPTENKVYNIVEVIYNGDRKVLMLTDLDVLKAIDRAEKNVEDYPKESWLKRIFG